MVGTASGVERGCGTREEGAAYVETGLDEDGDPVENFLVDPPREFVPDSKIGQELVEIEGVTHILDWIGEKHYPYPSDFVEEVRRYGLSRRINRNLDVGRITTESRILCIHARAVIEDVPEESPRDHAHERRCTLHWLTGDTDHLDDPSLPCTRKWYWDADGQEPSEEYPEDDPPSDYRDFASIAYGPVEGLDVPEPSPGFFASFPITDFAVIEAEDGSHEDLADDLAERADPEIPVITTDA